MEQVFATLRVFDPNKETICVAGAAIAVQIEWAGGEVGSQADVDVLCSNKFFENAKKTGPFEEGLRKFTVRWPYGTAGRALAPIIDFYPNDERVLPFSATQALGGSWYPTTFDKLENSEVITEIEGYLFLKIGEILRWTAVTGREKDMVKIDKLLPLADRLGLLSSKERELIEEEYNQSRDLRKKYPSRYYARVKDS